MTSQTPSVTDALERLREALAQTWKDGHRAGIGCGHDLAVCRHDDKSVEAEVDDLASWNSELQAALSAPAPTVDAAALRDIVDRCRQHTAGIGFDIITIRAAITESDRNEALDRLRAHIHAVDDILTAALRASAPGDEG